MKESVTIRLGPVPAVSAVAFLTNAKEVVASVRASQVAAAPELPDDVAEAFEGFLAEWLAVARRRDPFTWEGEIGSLLLRRLVSYWFELTAHISGRLEELGLPEAGPEAEPFYHQLLDAVTGALAEAEDMEEVGPRVRSVWPGVTDDDRAELEHDGAPIRVVIVDDTDDVRLLMRIALSRDSRFEIVGEAENGAEAIAVCDAVDPDVVLLDLMMPVMDGWQALPEIRRRSPKTRVVVHSALGRDSEGPRCTALGAAGYVTKSSPITDVADALVEAAASG